MTALLTLSEPAGRSGVSVPRLQRFAETGLLGAHAGARSAAEQAP
jgi:hypothetical protein